MAEVERIEIIEGELEASRVGLGTWAIGGWMWGGSDEADAVRTIHAALDHGIDFVDTAPVYGFGRSEEIVGRALAQDGRRQRAVLATKVGLDWQDEKPFRNASSARIEKEVEDSLRRLGTDVIDLYQIHWPDPDTPMEETAEAMRRLRDAGKIRAIGVSNFSPEQMAAFAEVAPLHTTQPPYNIFERGIEDDVLPWAKDHGVRTVTYGALCRGLLSGKMSSGRSFEGDDLRQADPKFQRETLQHYLNAVNELEQLAQDRFHVRVRHLAVRWLLDTGSDIALWGARRPEQIEDADRIWGWTLDAPTFVSIDQILQRYVPDPIGPEFMAPPRRAEARGEESA